MLDKMKELFAMQRKMSEIKKKLEGTDFELASSDGLVKITMNGAQEVREIRLKENISETDRIRLEKTLKDNNAIKKPFRYFNNAYLC